MTELPKSAQDAILAIIKKGNDAEVKKVNNHIVVVEIHRKVRDKAAITG